MDQSSSSPENSRPTASANVHEDPVRDRLGETLANSGATSLECVLQNLLQIDAQFGLETPKETLKRMLSSGSVVSATSPFARRHQAAAFTADLQNFRIVGRGACGTIFEQTGFGTVLKLAAYPSAKDLWNDCRVHTKVAKAFESHDLQVQIPVCHYFVVAKDNEWWDCHLEKFPPEFRIPTHVLCTERILPLPSVVRNALIDVFCPPFKIARAKLDEANKDCLVRLYLGKRRVSDLPSRFFTLRNMILHLDQLETLELDVEYYAEQMAEALAVLHWVARTDGRDIEFVLGSAPTAVRRSLEEDDLSDEKLACSTWKMALNQTGSKGRTIHLWILDFDQCGHMSMDDAGIKVAVDAFYLNDPYYPRPGSSVAQDVELWRAFRDRYLEKSREIIGDDEDRRSLPASFVQQVQQVRLINGTVVVYNDKGFSVFNCR